MDLPQIVKDLIAAQDQFDPIAYANCFTETAKVFDEGRTHTGRSAIEKWNADANKKYQVVLTPLEHKKEGSTNIVKTEIAGTFPGSPITLRYHFEIINGRIRSLSITD